MLCILFAHFFILFFKYTCKIELNIIYYIIHIIHYTSTNMEKRLNQKIEAYVTGFKNSIRSKIADINFEDKSKVNDLLEFVYDFERMSLSKDDLIKRKRIKNMIPVTNRCNAKRASGEQCTRRRKESNEFCGTHSKGTPNGFMHMDECGDCSMHKMEIFAEDINGIVYYIDKYKNVYRTEDVLSGKENPQIIAKCNKTDGIYDTLNFICV